MLAIHFNHTRQLLVTEQKEKGISYSEYLPFFKKKKKSNRKIISICLSCSFPIPLSSSLSCQEENDVIHRLFNWNCTQPNHRAAAPLEVSGKIPIDFNRSRLGLSMGREKYNISLGDPEKDYLNGTFGTPCPGLCPLSGTLHYWFLHGCRSCGFICLFWEPASLANWFYS